MGQYNIIILLHICKDYCCELAHPYISSSVVASRNSNSKKPLAKELHTLEYCKSRSSVATQSSTTEPQLATDVLADYASIILCIIGN